MSSQSPITFDSTLASVLSYDFRVSSTTLGQSIATKFAQNPDLPGVIIMDNRHFLGMISRAKFREQVNTAQRENLYFNQPIQMLLDYLRIPALLLDQNCKISDAVNSVLNRSKELIYEPIVVIFENKFYRILDIQTLLLAQNKLLNHAQNLIHQQQAQIQKYFQSVEYDKNQVRDCNKYHQTKQKEIKKNYDDFLKIKQQEIFETAQKITGVNQDFLQLSQLVITETNKSFHSISSQTNSIRANSNHIQQISELIYSDLESIYSSCNVIAKILQKIRHLAVQASIIAYQSQATPQSFSRVNAEINQMLNQILNVNHQMNKNANHFRFHAQKLQDIAENETLIARSILLKLERAELVIKELEKLIDSYDPNLIILIVEQAKTMRPELIPNLISNLENLVSSPEENSGSSSNQEHLIGLIEHTLRQKNNPSASDS